MPITRCNSAGFQILLGLALFTTTVAMLAPGSGIPLPFAHADKLAHMAGFLLLAFFADAGWPHLGFVRAKYLSLLAYGIGIECVQHFIPRRSFEVLDILADASGLLLYGTLVLPLLRRLQIR
jgi:VanZ family protein